LRANIYDRPCCAHITLFLATLNGFTHRHRHSGLDAATSSNTA
jgi:hypothetical protein